MLGMGDPTYTIWSIKLARSPEFAYLLEPNSELAYWYPSNPRGYFGENNEVIGHVNSQGFRGRATSTTKPPGAFRIAVLGDSFTMGTGVRDRDTLPAQLERELQRLVTGLEVLNFGVGGTDTVYQIHLLQRQVLKYKPDLVIVVMFLNDTVVDGNELFRDHRLILQRVRKYSFFLNALLGSIEKPFYHRRMLRLYQEGFEATSSRWRAVQNSLRGARDLCQQNNCKLLVTLYPVLFNLDDSYPFRSAHESVRRFCEGLNIPYVDLLAPFYGKDHTKLWVHETDHHPNEAAHFAAATQLGNFIREHKLLESGVTRNSETTEKVSTLFSRFPSIG
jgi:lysophospholipase L1-like esterase